jgi:predicted enzyme related to lactoylglutathione lyase
MADKTARGRFVWHELMTPDTSAAHAFYTKTLPWKTQAWEQDPSYSMFAAGSGPIGGTMASTEGGAHWMPYLGTTDIEATVRDATQLGATVKKDITSMPNGGKYAVLADPQGAVFGVYWSAQPASKETAPKRGEYSWHELTTTDPKAAFAFYSKVFGWDNAGEHQMGPDAVYYMFGRNGAPLGGLWKSNDAPPSWLGYVRVRDVHQTAKKVTASGGRVINGPMEVPGGTWIVQCTDPSGAMFAAHTLADDLKPAAGASAPAAEAPAAAAPEAAATPAAKPAAAKSAAAPARKKAAKKAAKKAKKVAKKAAKKAGKKRAAAKAARRPAKKAAKKGGRKVAKKKGRSGGKKKAARKPRKGK